MCLLRKYCFGHGTIRFDILSTLNPTASSTRCDGTQLAAETAAREFSGIVREGGTVGTDYPGQPQLETATSLASSNAQETDIFRFGLNYLNENVNVCMPVFAMHGNHGKQGLSTHCRAASSFYRDYFTQ